MNILELVGVIFLFFLVIIGSVVFLVSEIMTKKVKKEFSKFKGQDENRS